MTDYVPEVQLRRAVCGDGRVLSMGDRQMRWCEDRGLCTPTDEPGTWLSPVGTPEELNEMVMADAANRECDFCRRSPAGWRIKVRPFLVSNVATGEPEQIKRRMYACDDCVPYVRANRKAELVERSMEETIRAAREDGGQLRAVVESQPLHRIRAAMQPYVKSVVYGMFANREGWPERDD